jgi:hypothetical protein
MGIMPVPETLESLAASFDRVLHVEGKSERTRVLYGQSVRYFCGWRLAARPIPRQPALAPAALRACRPSARPAGQCG